MSRRFRCWSCKTAFLSDADDPGQPVVCPKCSTRQGPPTAGGMAAMVRAKNAAAPVPSRAQPMPAPVVEEPDDDPEESVFVARPRRSLKRLVGMLAAIAMLCAASVGLVVAWPALVRWWHPVPPDPIEAVAGSYLKALATGDAEATARLGTVDLPPAIRSYRDVRRDRSSASNPRLKGSFAPIAAFHAQINESFDYDASIGRFTPRNALGPAAETLDALHEAKAKMEKEGLNKKIESGDPDDLFDAAESLGKTFSGLAEGILAPKKLIPTYRQLVDEAKPPLPDAERALALDYAEHRPTWDALLKRPFLTLKADGPFLLERATVTARVVDKLASAGDPPTTLVLSLTRFQLEGIDTGWRITDARRAGATAATPPKPSPPQAPSEPSPRRSLGEPSSSPGR